MFKKYFRERSRERDPKIVQYLFSFVHFISISTWLIELYSFSGK